MKMLLRLFLVANLALLIGCKHDDKGGGGTPEPESAEPTTASLTLSNRYETTLIGAWYISPVDVFSWGSDQLEGLEGYAFLDTGRSFTVDGLDCSKKYDSKIEDVYGNDLAQWFDFTLPCGSRKTWRVGL